MDIKMAPYAEALESIFRTPWLKTKIQAVERTQTVPWRGSRQCFHQSASPALKAAAWCIKLKHGVLKRIFDFLDVYILKCVRWKAKFRALDERVKYWIADECRQWLINTRYGSILMGWCQIEHNDNVLWIRVLWLVWLFSIMKLFILLN